MAKVHSDFANALYLHDALGFSYILRSITLYLIVLLLLLLLLVVVVVVVVVVYVSTSLFNSHWCGYSV
jgi:hypothetical protein